MVCYTLKTISVEDTRYIGLARHPYLSSFISVYCCHLLFGQNQNIYYMKWAVMQLVNHC